MVSEVQLLVPQERDEELPAVIEVGLAVKLSIEHTWAGWLTETTTVLTCEAPLVPYAVNVYVVEAEGETDCEPDVFTLPSVG